jgi:hypothetical protein
MENDNLNPETLGTLSPETDPQPAGAEKKKRGRPKLIRENPQPVDSKPIDPGVEAKKRGRPAGSGNAQRKASSDIPAIANQLMFWHSAASKLLKQPLIEIERDEADMLAKSLAKLMEEYSIVISGKTAAIVGMLVSVGAIYGPRVMLIQEIKERERKQKTPELSAVNG